MGNRPYPSDWLNKAHLHCQTVFSSYSVLLVHDLTLMTSCVFQLFEEPVILEQAKEKNGSNRISEQVVESNGIKYVRIRQRNVSSIIKLRNLLTNRRSIDRSSNNIINACPKSHPTYVRPLATRKKRPRAREIIRSRRGRPRSCPAGRGRSSAPRPLASGSR